MNFTEFSKNLVTSLDLDPDYVFMLRYSHENNMTREELFKWICLKVFVYDTASEIQFLRGEKKMDELKYGAERQKSKKSSPAWFENLFHHINKSALNGNYTEIAKYLQLFAGMGKWASWKFCDLLERVYGNSITFEGIDFRIAYEYPLKGILAVNHLPDKYLDMLKDDDRYNRLLGKVTRNFELIQHLPSPPRFERVLNLQELETCLCKYHSYLNNHYYIGKDTEHLSRRLNEIGIDLKKYMP